jgi:DNA-binding IclR family transcriptional regulator
MSRLVELSWVQFNESEKSYSVGHGFLALAGQVFTEDSAARVATPLLQHIRDTFNETTVLGRYLEETHQLMFTARMDSSNPLQYRIPLFFPITLVRGATGLSILAFLSDETIEEVIQREAKAEQLTRSDVKLIRSELDATRARGFSITHGARFAGATGIAVPIMDLSSRVVGNVCLTLPTVRFPQLDNEAAIRELSDAALAIGSLLS